MASYATLTLLKQSLGISDTTRDALLQQALDAASAQIDRMANRTFGKDVTPTTRTYRVLGRVVPDAYFEGLLVDDIADPAGATVATGYYIGPYTAYTGWSADPVLPGWPTTILRGIWVTQQVQVTATWGWPAVPTEIVQATLMQASRLFKRKDSPEGVMGSADWGAVRVSRVDPDVQALVAPYVNVAIV